MFNDNIKTEYLYYCQNKSESYRKKLINLFNKTESLEVKKDKDIFDWNLNDIIEFYKYINTGSVDVLYVYNSMFNHYVVWAISQLYVNDSQNHFQEVDANVFEACINTSVQMKRIVTRERLMQCINNLENPSDAFILLAIFEGVKDINFNVLYTLTTRNIYEDNGIYFINLQGKQIQISNELANLAFISAQTYDYVAIGGEMLKQFRLEGEPELIVKEYPNIKKKDRELVEKRLYVRFKKLCDISDLSMAVSINSLCESGRLQMIADGAKKDNCTKKEWLFNNIDFVIYRYGKIYATPYIRKYSSFFND